MDVILITSLALALLIAVVTDLRSRTIPNALVIAGVVGALGSAAFADPFGRGTAILSALLGVLVGGGVLLPLYLVRGCGAGDVKLMAMVGTFVGPSLALQAGLYTFLTGGLLGLLFMSRRATRERTARNLRSMVASPGLGIALGDSRTRPIDRTAARLPYAVAIAAGTALALVWPLWPTVSPQA
jgi:prepilin peptidase CpaA